MRRLPRVPRFVPVVCLSVATLAAATPSAMPQTTSRPPPRTTADSLTAACDSLFLANQYDAILDRVQPIIRDAESSADTVLLGRALTQRGRARLVLGRLDEAEHDLERGIRLAESARDTTTIMPALHFRAMVFITRSRNEDALRSYERRLELAQQTRSPVDEAWARSGMGYVLHLLDRHEQSRQEYLRSIRLFQAAGLTRLEISPLIGLGRVETALGNDARAMQCYQRAWVASRASGDRLNEMWAANNMGAMESARGDLSMTAAYQQRAYEIALELQHAEALPVPAMNLAKCAQRLGDLEKAEALLTSTREWYLAHGGGNLLSQIDLHLASLRTVQGRNQEAIGILRPLVATLAELEPQHRDEAVALLARALAESDSAEAAVFLLSSYVARGEDLMYSDDIPATYLLLAGLHLRADHASEGFLWASRAREAAEIRGARYERLQAMLLESIFERRSGDTQAAAVALHAALDSLETIRGGITTPEWRETYGQEMAQYAIDAASVFLEESAAPQESSRTRAFFDAVQRIKARTLLDRVTAPRRDGAAPADGPRSQRITSLAEVQSVLRAGEVLLDFCVGTRVTFLIVVTSDSSRVVRLPGPESPLADRVRLIRAMVASEDASVRSQFDPERRAVMQRSLGRELVGDAADVIERASRLLISADGFLATVPFNILITAGADDVLMARHDVVEIPSASLLVLERTAGRHPPDGNSAIVAIASSDTRLVGARNEVRDLARQYRNVRAVLGEVAARGLESAAAGCEVLHIAAHARVVDRSPWQSGFQLTDTIRIDAANGATRRPAGEEIEPGFLSSEDMLRVVRAFPPDPYLRAWQIAGLRLDAGLAVLSGCETAGGRVTTGEGTLGLTAAFLSAGVPAVVSSLWPIEDRATHHLMDLFYDRLAEGEPVATALRRAQLEMRKSPQFAHPYFWAGFTVVGDGSRVVQIEKRRPPLLLAIAGVTLLVAVLGFLARRWLPNPGRR
ncbi:MAG: CHAT domain-containing protein [bacterium]